jgi:L-methionine (R)-S-oxide reductase
MTISAQQLASRYDRIATQLEELFAKYKDSNNDATARMATIVALLHHKLPHFFWTGFYRVLDGDLVVGPYQGPLACAVLRQPEGVCWAGITQKKSIIVPDVHAFPGHVACDSRSASEIVVPVHEPGGNIVAILDVDSDEKNSFSEVDQKGLEKIVALISSGY